MHVVRVHHPAVDRVPPVAQHHDTVRSQTRGHARGQLLDRGRAQEVADLGDHDEVEPGARRASGSARRGPRPRPSGRFVRRSRAASSAASDRSTASTWLARSASDWASRPVEQPSSRARSKRRRGSTARTRLRLRSSYHRVSTPHGSECSRCRSSSASSGHSPDGVVTKCSGPLRKCSSSSEESKRLVALETRERLDLRPVGADRLCSWRLGGTLQREGAEQVPGRLVRVEPSARTTRGTPTGPRPCAAPRPPRPGRRPRGRDVRRCARARPGRSRGRHPPGPPAPASPPRRVRPTRRREGAGGAARSSGRRALPLLATPRPHASSPARRGRAWASPGGCLHRWWRRPASTWTPAAQALAISPPAPRLSSSGWAARTTRRSTPSSVRGVLAVQPGWARQTRAGVPGPRALKVGASVPLTTSTRRPRCRTARSRRAGRGRARRGAGAGRR